MFHFQSVGYFCTSLSKWKDFEKPCDKSLLTHIPNIHTSSMEHAVRHVWLTCHLCKCVSGRKGWEGRAVAINLREGLHEVCAGRPGRAMGPAAVRHRVQPGQLHALPAVALYEPRTDIHTRIHTHTHTHTASICWPSRTWSSPEESPTAAVICPNMSQDYWGVTDGW